MGWRHTKTPSGNRRGVDQNPGAATAARGSCSAQINNTIARATASDMGGESARASRPQRFPSSPTSGKFITNGHDTTASSGNTGGSSFTATPVFISSRAVKCFAASW